MRINTMFGRGGFSVKPFDSAVGAGVSEHELSNAILRQKICNKLILLKISIFDRM